jgi:hypothetical protein
MAGSGECLHFLLLSNPIIGKEVRHMKEGNSATGSNRGLGLPRRWNKPRWSVVMAVLGALIVVIALVRWGSNWGTAPVTEPGAPAAGPRLTVDRDDIDLGTQPFERRVSAVFQVSNVGDRTLNILGEPAVALVEGC